MVIVGHVLALRLPFANGNLCNFKRPFLVISKDGNNLSLLNISSTKGKERKLLFDSNCKIVDYYPPLDKPSFVKLDELYKIEHFDTLYQSIYKGREGINNGELKRLMSEYNNYKTKYQVRLVTRSIDQVKRDNQL